MTVASMSSARLWSSCIAARIVSPLMSSHGVVMMRAFALCSRSSATTASSFSWLMPCVRLSRIVPAYSIWLRKNSPKFLTYMRHLPASATVTKLPISASGMSFSTPSTARITSESLPTPLGSIRMRSG